MAKLCIPSPTVEKIKQALVSGKLSVEKLYNMPTSEARQAEFAKFLPKELAKFVNTKFEAAAASRNRNALANFFKEITTEKEKEVVKKANILDKIKKLEDADLINTESQTATFTDLVSARLGLGVTGAEIEQITARAANISQKQEKLITAQNKPVKSEKNPKGLSAAEYFKQREPAEIAYYAALTDMDKFLNELSPTHTMAVITGSLFRGNMLLSLAPATVNNISNLAQGMAQAAERRVASHVRIVGGKIKFEGIPEGTNNDAAIQYAKMVIRTFHETGYDISREYAQDMTVGEKLVHNEGPSVTDAVGFRAKAGALTRKAARGQAKIVFKYLLGYSDVISAAYARADSSNIQAAKMAQMEKLSGQQAKDRSLELLVESTKIAPDPTTKLGEDALIIHSEAISDAEAATWTNKGFIAQKAQAFRDWLNGTTGDLQLGFWTMPFVKTGSNVIQFGIESSPIGGMIALKRLKPALDMAGDKVNPDMKPLQDVIRLATRSGLGWILSAILIGMLDPDDFLGAYDAVSQKERELMGLKKGVYNAVKIGDKWVSLDFFGPLGATMVGMMYAKKYGDTLPEKSFKFLQGAGQQVLQVPGLTNYEDLVKSLRKLITADTAGEGLQGIASSTVNAVRSRAIPGIVGTIAKGSDDKVRKIDRKNLLDSVKANIPGLRQTLPAKVDITTGEDVKGEGFFTNVIFGSRVKTANESKLISEISRLDTEGQTPTIADIERSSSHVQLLKTQISENLFQRALQFFGKEYGRRATRLISTAAYQRANDEDKKKMINKIRTDTRADMLEKFHFRKPLKGRR